MTTKYLFKNAALVFKTEAAQSKKLSGFWALGALLMRLPVHAVGIPPLTGVTGRVGTENLTHSHGTGEFR